MSGGAYDYSYSKVQECAELLEYFVEQMKAKATAMDIEPSKQRNLFAEHCQKLSKDLSLLAVAMQKIEWVDSGDGGEGEEAAIDACLKTAAR